MSDLSMHDQRATELANVVLRENSGGVLLVAIDDADILALVRRARVIDLYRRRQATRARDAMLRRKQFQVLQGGRG